MAARLSLSARPPSPALTHTHTHTKSTEAPSPFHMPRDAAPATTAAPPPADGAAEGDRPPRKKGKVRGRSGG